MNLSRKILFSLLLLILASCSNLKTNEIDETIEIKLFPPVGKSLIQNTTASYRKYENGREQVSKKTSQCKISYSLVGDRYLMTQESINDAVRNVGSKDFMSNAKFVYVFHKEGRAVDLYGYDEIFEKMKAAMAGGQWDRFSKSINVQSLKQHDIAAMNNENAFLYGTKWRVGTKYKQPIESSREWPSEYEKSIGASRIEECNMSKCLILESESILKKANFADQIDRVLGKGSAAKGYRITDITKKIEKVDINTGISLSSKSETVIEIFSAEAESLFRYEISTQSELGGD